MAVASACRLSGLSVIGGCVMDWSGCRKLVEIVSADDIHQLLIVLLRSWLSPDGSCSDHLVGDADEMFAGCCVFA